jgi:carboxylesterase type B
LLTTNRIHDGDYVQGSKHSEDVESLAKDLMLLEPIILVSINYRLGPLGWLAGPRLEGEGGIPNAALRDQRLAIEWVNKNIHLFGGDNQRVTLFGQGAGGECPNIS